MQNFPLPIPLFDAFGNAMFLKILSMIKTISMIEKICSLMMMVGNNGSFLIALKSKSNFEIHFLGHS